MSKDRAVSPAAQQGGINVSIDQLTFEATTGRLLAERAEIILKMNQAMRELTTQLAMKDAEIDRLTGVNKELQTRLDHLRPRAVRDPDAPLEIEPQTS